MSRDVVISLYVVPFVAQVVAPVALLLWPRVARGRSRAFLLLRTLLTAAYLTAIALAGLWLVVPWLIAMVYLVVLAVQVRGLVRLLRPLPWWPDRPAGWMGLVLSAVLAMVSAGLAAQAIAGRQPPPGPMIDLDFPLRNAIYVAGQWR